MTTMKPPAYPDYHIERIRIFHTPKERADEGLIIGMSATAGEKLLHGKLQRRLGQMGYALFDVPAEAARDDTYCDVQVEVRPPMSEEHLQALGHDIVSGALEASWSHMNIDVQTHGVAVTDHRVRLPDHPIDSGPYVIANSLQYVRQQPRLRAAS